MVEKAQSGNFDAIKELVSMHESWIFNISLRMTGNTQDAEDATQEILIKMLTKLSTFESKSSFRTWLYRIATNHVLNMKRSQRENFFLSFEKHKNFISESDGIGEKDRYSSSPDEAMLVDAIKVQCTMGMLLCLDRRQRLIFILGFIFGVSSKTGGEMLEISQDSFKQELHRARTQLKNYMNENCSLINKSNSCSCERKKKKAMDLGLVDRNTNLFNDSHVAKVKDFVKKSPYLFEKKSIKKIREQFLRSPFIESNSVVEKIKGLI